VEPLYTRGIGSDEVTTSSDEPAKWVSATVRELVTAEIHPVQDEERLARSAGNVSRS
jgi:hypothetical protein